MLSRDKGKQDDHHLNVMKVSNCGHGTGSIFAAILDIVLYC